jgi:hypothetical protein
MSDANPFLPGSGVGGQLMPTGEMVWCLASDAVGRLEAETGGAVDESRMATGDPHMVYPPTTFGDEALWYAKCSTQVSARSVGYVDLISVDVKKLLRIAAREPAIRMRYRTFRDAMHTFDLSHQAA